MEKPELAGVDDVLAKQTFGEALDSLGFNPSSRYRLTIPQGRPRNPIHLSLGPRGVGSMDVEPE
jgi:hypothetical protein